MLAEGALVALSGGVDSSLSLSLTSGRFPGRTRACYLDMTGRGAEPAAVSVCQYLGIPLEVISVAEVFTEEVVSRSVRMVSIGLTPNPCALCNAKVKLGILADRLDKRESLVTGHYVISPSTGSTILRGADPTKDQSYFLSLVPWSVLGRCTFPLGIMTKEQVRRDADTLGLPCRRGESMDLCFDLSDAVPDREPGRIVGLDGTDYGSHEGLHHYTIGQRSRLASLRERMFVVSKDVRSCRLIIGRREDLLSDGCLVEEMNWFSGDAPDPGAQLFAQTRYRRRAVHAFVEETDEGLKVHFSEPEEAVAPGQVCALYLNNKELLGGGLISSVLRRESQ